VATCPPSGSDLAPQPLVADPSLDRGTRVILRGMWDVHQIPRSARDATATTTAFGYFSLVSLTAANRDSALKQNRFL